MGTSIYRKSGVAYVRSTSSIVLSGKEENSVICVADVDYCPDREAGVPSSSSR